MSFYLTLYRDLYYFPKSICWLNYSPWSPTALKWFTKSKETFIAWNTREGGPENWPTVTKKNTDRCLFYLGQFDEAEKLLNISIAEFKAEKVRNWAVIA